jgi:hypothetical protein
MVDKDLKSRHMKRKKQMDRKCKPTVAHTGSHLVGSGIFFSGKSSCA